jgi:hypothetical protein
MSRASTSDLVTIRSFDVVLILFTITRNSKTESQYDLLTLARNAHSVAAGLGFGDVGPPDPIQSCVRRVLQSLSETSYIWKGEKNPLSAQFSVLVIKPSPPPRRPHHHAVPTTTPSPPPSRPHHQANLLYGVSSQPTVPSQPIKPPYQATPYQAMSRSESSEWFTIRRVPEALIWSSRDLSFRPSWEIHRLPTWLSSWSWWCLVSQSIKSSFLNQGSWCQAVIANLIGLAEAPLQQHTILTYSVDVGTTPYD